MSFKYLVITTKNSDTDRNTSVKDSKKNFLTTELLLLYSSYKNNNF